MIKYRISQIEVKLSGNFIRVHKSYIVNKKSSTALSSNIMEIGKITVPIGETHKPAVEQFSSVVGVPTEHSCFRIHPENMQVAQTHLHFYLRSISTTMHLNYSSILSKACSKSLIK